MRGMARIFHGWDMVADLPIEVYLVAAMGDNDAKYGCDLFERVVKGRSSAFSPFLLNIRDTQIDDQGNYFLITERFVGTDLGVPLARGQTTHPFGALCIAHQVCLALHELHCVGVIHGGLAPRCIRLNREQTSSKIVDFEFAVPSEFVERTAGVFEGYPQIMPPERVAGAPVSVQQDIYQVANLLLRLVCGKPAVSEGWTFFRGRGQDENPIVVEDPRLRERLLEELTSAVERAWPAGNPWLEERVRETSSRAFLAESLVPLLVKCLAPEPEDRPRNCYEVIAALQEFGVPPVGHIVDRSGSLVPGGLFSLEDHE
jgi:serine/threonine protein kinase